MPVSKKRNTNKNSGPTKSKKLSSQMSDVSGPSPRWFVVTMSSLMFVVITKPIPIQPSPLHRYHLDTEPGRCQMLAVHHQNGL